MRTAHLRDSFTNLSLRSRLTAGFLVFLLAACVIIAAATAISLRSFLVSRLGQQLVSAGERFSASLEQGGAVPVGSDGDADNAPGGQAEGTLGVRILGESVTNAAIVTETGAYRSVTFPRQDQRILAEVPTTGTPTTVRLSAIEGDYLIRAVAGRDGDVQVTGLPLHPVEETVGRLLVIEGGIFAVLLLGVGVGTAFFVRRTLRPLNEVTARALAVSELPLATGEVELPSHDGKTFADTEVGRVNSAFDHMLGHVELALNGRAETEAKLRRFVADASHELRTPLATIRSHAELARRSETDLPSTVERALSRVEAESIRMADLVEDLLLLASLDAKRRLAEEDVDLSRIAIETMADARVSAPDHHWQLDLPEQPVELVGDPDRLRQVVLNLLTNAHTHTPAGSTVSLVLSLDKSAENVTIAVHDDGPGIPADLQPVLFERFSRADAARTRSAGGTGLGLAIVAGIVRAHRGTITVTSSPGDTTVQVTLPTSTRT